jgi:hypothetical protein
MWLVPQVCNRKQPPKQSPAATADQAHSRKFSPDQVRLWHLYFVLHLGILALTVDPVRENPWRASKKASRRGSCRYEALTAGLDASWYDSRIMPFLAGTAGDTSLEIGDLEELPRWQEAYFSRQDAYFITLV